MSKLDLVRHLYGYNEWANGRLLEAASALSEDQLGAARGASFGSIRDSFAHIAAAQAVWLGRWTGKTNSRPLREMQEMPDMEAVRASFLSSHGGLNEFVSRLTEERLEASLDYRNSRGEAYSRPLWQLMTHLANHSTYHRGEIALLLSELGHSPGDIDLLHWQVATET